MLNSCIFATVMNPNINIWYATPTWELQLQSFIFRGQQGHAPRAGIPTPCPPPLASPMVGSHDHKTLNTENLQMGRMWQTFMFLQVPLTVFGEVVRITTLGLDIICLLSLLIWFLSFDCLAHNQRLTVNSFSSWILKSGLEGNLYLGEV